MIHSLSILAHSSVIVHALTVLFVEVNKSLHHSILLQSYPISSSLSSDFSAVPLNPLIAFIVEKTISSTELQTDMPRVLVKKSQFPSRPWRVQYNVGS